MASLNEMAETARGEIAWHIEGRATRAAALRRLRAHARTLQTGPRERNAVVRSLAGASRPELLRCATRAARRRTAATLRANAQCADERTDWDALPCGEQGDRVEQIQYAFELARELERYDP